MHGRRHRLLSQAYTDEQGSQSHPDRNSGAQPVRSYTTGFFGHNCSWPDVLDRPIGERQRAEMQMEAPLSEELIRQAIACLDRILEEHAVRFVHLDRATLVERIEAIRVEATACRAILVDRRSLQLG